MAFDVQGALSSGYSPTEVADYLGKEKKFDVEGARQSGYSDDDIIGYLQQAKKPEEGVVGSFKKGVEQLVSTGRTAAESLYKTPEEAALAGQKREEEISKKYGEGVSFDKLQQIYKEKGIIPAAGELVGQIPKAIAEQGGNIGATLGGAGAGFLAAGPIGAIAGAALPSFIQQYGGNIQRQAQAQQEAGQPLDISRGKAAGTAIPQTALDVAQTFIPFGGKIAGKVFGPAVGKLLGAGEGAAAEKLAKEGLMATIAKGTATGVVAEVPTEVTQQMLERAQAGLSITDKDAFKEYGETAFAVSLLGPLGIIGRISNKAEAGRTLAMAQSQASETNEPQTVPLQLTYDPNVPDSRGTETFTVFPDGRIAPSEPAAFSERYKTISTIPSAEEEAQLKPLLPPEIGFKTQPVAMIEPDGTVKTYEGVPNKGETGINLLDENKKVIKTIKPDTKSAIINPTEQDIFNLQTKAMELQLPKMRQDLERSRIESNKADNAFKQFLKDHPLKSTYYKDIINASHNPNRMLSDGQSKGIFTKGVKDGYELDDLALIAREIGFMTDEEINNPDDTGGTNALTDKIAAIYNGESVPTPYSADANAKYQALDEAYRKIDEEVQGRKEQVKQFPTEEEEIVPEFTPPEEATPADVVTGAEYATREPVVPSFRAEVAKTPFTDKFLADQEAFTKTMRNQLNRMGLSNVALKFEDTLQAHVNGQLSPVNGMYFEKLIQVALSGDHPERTLNHEALHAMKDLGFFSDKDWQILSSAAKSKWMEKYDIAKGYGKESPEIQIEEAIAHAFADYQTQPSPIKRIMAKIIDHLKKIGNFIRGRGYKTAEDIFGKAAEGKLEATKETTRTIPVAEIPRKAKLKTALQGVDPEYAQKIIEQFTQEPATVKEKMENLKKGFFDRMVTGLFDEFRAIKKYTPEGYMMARMSKSIDGALQGLLEYGQVFNDGGALNIRKGTKGLLDILKPLGTEVDQYQIWKALNRDANLSSDRRSFNLELVAGRNKLAAGNLNGKPRKEIYEQALKEENELNKSVLKIALDSGLIDQNAYDTFSKDIYYIPFYKVMEDGDISSISSSSKLTGQEFSKMLKGGEKKTNDLMENVLMNWSHILSASMKNQAAKKTIDAAVKMDAAEIATQTAGKYPPGTVKIMRAGQVVHYTLTDPDLVDAISTISYLGPKSAFLDVAKGFTNALRYGITMSPAYKIRNLMRDSVQSAAISDLSPNLFSNVYNGLTMSKAGHPTFMSALAGGGIFEMGVAHEGNQAKLIRRLIDKGVSETTILDTPDKIKAKLQSALDYYNEIGNKFENANRLALYQKLLDSGKTHLEASYAARDLMDFSMQGQFRAIKVIGSVVPFFNARLQGLYKLGRDGVSPTYRVICNATTGKPLKEGDKMKAAKFTTISSAVMLASMALYGMYKDDEDFQRREPWDRDNFWWFKIGDTQYRIPKPFEIGALGTIAERTYEQISDENIEGKVFGERLQSMLANTFSMNPMPQMIKPMIDLYANTDSFTGAPIESAGMERLSKQERKTNHTSGLAIALGGISQAAAQVLTMNPQAEGFSPIQMDYGIKAYFGWLGATAASTADLAVEPFQEGTKVHKPLIDTVAMGFIKTMPETQSRYMTDFYKNNANLQSTLADMRHYAELGDQEKLTKLMEEKGQDVGLAKVYDATSKQLAQLRKTTRLIEVNQNIPADERRAEITRLQILMSDMAKQVEDMRISLKK
jgi:Large polyvalent protein associated domain 38